MRCLRDILTGANNETVAIGRFIGIALLALVVLTPIVELLTVAYRLLGIDEWAKMLDQWQVFMPVMIATAGGAIAGTAFTEPKAPKGQNPTETKNEPGN